MNRQESIVCCKFTTLKNNSVSSELIYLNVEIQFEGLHIKDIKKLSIFNLTTYEAGDLTIVGIF